MDKATTSEFLLRRRPPSEKLVDMGFKNFVFAMASMVAVILFSIFDIRARNSWLFIINHILDTRSGSDQGTQC